MASGLTCHQCGAEGRCYCRDVGGLEYYDEYTFFCEKCGYTQKETKYGGSPLSANWPTTCPFCGRYYDEHKEAVA